MISYPNTYQKWNNLFQRKSRKLLHNLIMFCKRILDSPPFCYCLPVILISISLPVFTCINILLLCTLPSWLLLCTFTCTFYTAGFIASSLLHLTWGVDYNKLMQKGNAFAQFCLTTHLGILNSSSRGSLFSSKLCRLKNENKRSK